jgi:hypothetical protein
MSKQDQQEQWHKNPELPSATEELQSTKSSSAFSGHNSNV